MKKIFITGSSGMLAQSLINKINNCDEYSLLDTSGLEYYSNDFHFINNKLIKNKELDITNKDMLNELSSRILKDDELIVVHTAAYVNTDKCEKYSYEAVKSNIYGTQLLIDFAKKHNAFFVYLSTTAVYDPEHYMTYGNGTFVESAKIDPKTIYGLTKYLGEVAVKQSIDKDKYIVLKPVFFYGDAPHDNSSMLRKIIERIYLNDKSGLDVLLDPKIEKDYCRSEIFAEMTYKLFNANKKQIAGQDYIISRNSPKPFSYYLKIIERVTNIKSVYDYINIKAEDDYLQRHNGISNNFYKIFDDYKLPESAYDDEYGISKTYQSIVRLYETM